MLTTLNRLLQGRFEVVASNDARQALSLLDADGDFAVVVADVNMPEMNGLEFLDAVRQVSPTTIRVALTGTEVDAAALPADAIFRLITKPFAADALIRNIQDAANYHALLSASPIQPVEAPRTKHAALPPPGGLPPDSQGGAVDLYALMTRPVQIREGDAAPALTVETPAAAARVGLRLLDRTVELLEGTTLIGRSRTCHVSVHDPHVSRRHACIRNEAGALSVKNVSSTNQLLVNGRSLPLEESCPLEVGDRIRLGSHELELCLVGDYCPSIEPTQRLSQALAVDETLTLSAVSMVAEKYFLLGQTREAERILRPLLHGLARHARGRAPLARDARLAVSWALRLAESSHAAEWVNYIFDLHRALRQPASHEVVECLYRIIPETPGIHIGAYRAYLEALEGLLERMGPAQRFLIRRIQGLETRLMMTAHV